MSAASLQGIATQKTIVLRAYYTNVIMVGLDHQQEDDRFGLFRFL
jgi:hypothetical protein